MLVSSISMMNSWGWNIGLPLLQSVLLLNYSKIHFNRILKKGMFLLQGVAFKTDDTNIRPSLLLFHFLWNHNSKGLVSPPMRPIGFVEISPFCKNLFFLFFGGFFFYLKNSLFLFLFKIWLFRNLTFFLRNMFFFQIQIFFIVCI